jgi:hypothetical protein
MRPESSHELIVPLPNQLSIPFTGAILIASLFDNHNSLQASNSIGVDIAAAVAVALGQGPRSERGRTERAQVPSSLQKS